MTRLYRVALYLLPSDLRRKHGAAMETLFARDVEAAWSRGRLHGVLTVAAGVRDVVTRAAYEQVRPSYGIHVERTHAEGSSMDGPLVPLPSAANLLRRLAVSFTVAFAVLTGLMLLQYASRQILALQAKGAGTGIIVEALLLAVPFTAAMTIPMAVFVAVLSVFTRLGANGTLGSAVRWDDGGRRLVMPVLSASAVVATLALVLTTQVLPHANARLSATLRGDAAASVKSDRTMTVGELREAARHVVPNGNREALERVASYEVEVHKKFALPAACMVLALAGMAIAWRFPRGGTWMLLGASLAVFSVYYVMLMAGENLADRLVISPLVAMWGANALLLGVALLVGWRRGGPSARGGRGAVVLS
jgi:lipopolysaccharide export LptBFGC system permease protein LptF